MKETRYVVVEKSCCGTCGHYRQHYVLQEGGRPYPLWYGHCCTPREKRRAPDEVCPHWEASGRSGVQSETLLEDPWYPPANSHP